MSLPIKVNDQSAYFLHRINYGESSLIIDCLTLDYGRVSLMVKGGRKRKNQANFQVFQHLQINFTGKSDLKTLTGLECIANSLSFKANLAGLYVNELLIYLLPKHQECGAIFGAYQRLLLQLDDSYLEQPLRDFEYQLLNYLGVLPDFTTDVLTGELIVEGCAYSYHPQQGFTITSKNKGFLGEYILAIAQGSYDKMSLIAAKQIMRKTIHLQLNGKELKTRALFQQLFSKKSQ